MRKFASHTIGVDQGDAVLFSDFEDEGEMWTGHGARLKRLKVAFSESFDAAPAVTVALSMWDFGHDTNVRADVQAEKITPKGFEVVFRTWGDTRVARVRVAWQAIGAISDEEAWDI
ncbi:H-type lectin domain-containing protein [Yoonia sp. R2331]|uniref:H-type lectin domain-containing protein n=1 Tax=Yoonia sp. R2331 TaxID=3237238 RepID=UPI0034E58164